jgi:3-dehydroquinate synthase
LNTGAVVKKIKVCLDRKQSQSYEICIGYDILNRIAMMIANSGISDRYVIVTDDCVRTLYGEDLLAHLRNMGVKSDLIAFPTGERSKNFQTVLDLSKRLLDLGVDRKSALIALGGGVAGDLTGFVASVFMRGIPVIQVPTTLMAQVDSSIGGKTGINLPTGKNLLGTFHQPEMVLTDIKFLETLPEKEFNNGLSEVVKYGAIKGEPLFGKLENGIDLILDRNVCLLEEIITIACTIKADIVGQDEREKDVRRILNFGHTLGHAMETASRYTFSHGGGVAVGMIAAARLSERISDLDREEVCRIEQLIVALGLEKRVPPKISTDDMLSALRQDKKKIGDSIHFVMLRTIGEPFVVKGVAEQVLRETIEGLRA